jgi:AcrR family transcriptional regulator
MVPNETDTRRSSRRELQRTETRARLFDAAVAEFQRRGFADAEVAAIADAAGVSRGSFYFHFPTKEHVLAELERVEERCMVDGLRPLLVSPSDLAGILSALVDSVTATERRLGPALMRDLLALYFWSSTPVPEAIAEHPLLDFVIAAFARAAAEGEIDASIDSGEMSVIFLTGLFGLLTTSEKPSESRDRLVRRFIAITINGMRSI